MHMADPNKIANKVLGKLRAYYGQDNVEEVVINRPEEVLIKWRRGEWEAFPAPELTYDHLHRLCSILANINSAKFSETELPVVSCELPGAPFRFQCMMGPNVRYNLDDRRGVALAVRSLVADASINFESYGLKKGVALPGPMKQIDDFIISADHVQTIKDVIARHETILISGATSSGKTTFANKVIELIPREERILTVEDTREVHVPHLNKVHFVVQRNNSTNKVGYQQIIDSLMRLTPDWIICGEVSVENAHSVYSLMGKGHPVITTIHADSPEGAVSALAENISKSSGKGAALSGQDLLSSMRRQIGCIIQIVRHNGPRQVSEITFPSREFAQD